MRLVLATANRGKLAELRRILADVPVDLVTMDQLAVDPPEETGATFEENALLKARAVSGATGLAALADDSGLQVDALSGAPGVLSARYAGRHGDDAANNARLLAELAEVPDHRRTARFVCVAALVTPDGRAWTTHGTMQGRIARTPSGSGGFGYDPLFVGLGETRTNAELPPEVKDARSHRGAAFRALRPIVEELVAGG
ncbi:MAG TPA: RdgB/HAM1 family non-canonical purine NTP pyrophosphatase [Nitriliruptorales bacterium]|nr:RdgB/HAM1 family non-canonical purine NTP pyrophosphatase [Nitriliruptorales bacterium]